MVYNGCMERDNKPLRPLTVRFPPELLIDMRRFAKEDDRPLNSEIVRVLREYVVRRKAERD